jgi:hypothetical protein
VAGTCSEVLGASVVDRGCISSTFWASGVSTAAAASVVASEVVPIAVSILGASSETLVDFFSGDFERPRDLNWEVSRRPRLSFLGVGGLNSASSVGAVSVVAGAGSEVSAVAAAASPFVRFDDVALSLLFGSRPAKILCRLVLTSGVVVVG